MQRELPVTSRPPAAALPADPPAHPGILVTRRGWRAQDWLEQGVLQELLAKGPDAAGEGPALYAGFPWSALIDSLENPGQLDAAFLGTALRTLGLLVPKGGTLVTTCQHPHLPAHLDRLAAAGVSDLFWPGILPEGQILPLGLRLHRLPALPPPGSPAPAGEGPGGHFSFCSAENGGNTPGLWAALAAGLVPVLPLTAPALPGPAALWPGAAVLHRAEDPALAERLAAITADPAQLAALQAGGAGLGLILGPGRLSQAVHLCRLAQAAAAYVPPPPAPDAGASHLPALLERVGALPQLPPGLARQVLQAAGDDLLRGRRGGATQTGGPEGAAVWRVLAKARAALSPGDPAAIRLDAVLEQTRGQGRPGGMAETAGGVIRVHLLGPRGQRTPLAYPALHPHLRGRIHFTERPDAADLIVTGWCRDLEDNREMLAQLCREGGPRLVVLSEEPLWDSLWTPDPLARDLWLDCGAVQLPWRNLNHVNSDIFAFHHLPWFEVSDERFPVRHAALIAEFAALSPRALLGHWAQAPLQAAFVAERRSPAGYAANLPLAGMTGLSPYRSRVAELTGRPGVLRLGKGWPEGTGSNAARRQDLPDWHLDKLARLHGRVRLCGAWENTLQRDYVTEKPFDAFAIGAVPAVAADAGHRLTDLILPEAMLNTARAPADVAAARITAFTPDLLLAEAWRDSAQGLLARLRDTAALLDERQRIADACLAELDAALTGPLPVVPPPPVAEPG